MKSFITNVVQSVLNKQQNLENVTFVLPSQRACVFVKDEIVNHTPYSGFLPKIVSIENFIQDVSGINLIDNTQLLFEFYNAYSKITSEENCEPFETFISWASIALQDFNELDSNLVNVEELFSNLKDIKKLSVWFQDKKPSKLATNYLHFFENLNKLYSALYNNLLFNKVGYQGILYREATKNLTDYCSKNKNNQFVFVGFNALNKAEEVIFKFFIESNLATIFWDCNENILQKNNEAGVFLRKYKSEWTYYKKNPFLFIESEKPENQTIQILGAPKNVAQIKYAGELLQSFQNLNKTAVVLADENLLPLAINALPKNVTSVNITMGYPLKDIPISSLFTNVFKLYLNQQKFNKVTVNKFYYKDVLGILNNSFLLKLFGSSLIDISEKIKEENHVFLDFKFLQNSILHKNSERLELLFQLFKLPNNVTKITEQFLSFLSYFKNELLGVEKEYLFRYYLLFQQLNTLNKKYNYIKNIKTLSVFYNQLLANEKVSFQGEPLQGLQLMGMLETRAVDFETVIITSVNEGVLPKAKQTSSFIPFDVKVHFNLPTYHEKDAIFSYHFQRLISRAKNVFLLYNTEADSYGSGEKSRFLTKLEIENKQVQSAIISSVVTSGISKSVVIPKTEKIENRITEIFNLGVSPSTLANYIYNPLKFYEQKILKIREDDEVEETIAYNTMGTVIHEVLKELYQPFINKQLLESDLKEMHLKLDALLKKYFAENYGNGNLLSGMNKLIYEVSKNQIIRFLKQEQALLKKGNTLIIKALEESYSCLLPIKGISFPVKISGNVDRIDELNGVTRIIDYKTGKVEENDLKLNDLEVIKTDYKYTKALQVLMYALIYSENNKSINQLEAGIISFKNLNKGFLKMNFAEKQKQVENEITQEKLNNFKEVLSDILLEIYNKNEPFVEKLDLPF